MNHALRCESMRHCHWVDQVLEDAPWVISSEYIAKYNIDFVAHDALPCMCLQVIILKYNKFTLISFYGLCELATSTDVDLSGASATGDVYSPIKIAGKFMETQRTDGIRYL